MPYKDFEAQGPVVDEQSTFQSAIRTLVAAQPNAAAEGLETLARKKLETIDETSKALARVANKS